MGPDLFINRILDDEALTSGLQDPEARLLIEWLVEQVEHIVQHRPDEASAESRIQILCRRIRGIRRFLSLWCYAGDRGAAAQLAAAERFAWPLPGPEDVDPCDILQRILCWEQKHLAGGAGTLLNQARKPTST